jgi:hypothetical protein
MTIKLALRKLQARTPPPSLPESRPRPVRLTGAGKAVAFIGVLLLAGAPLAGFFLHSLAVSQRAFRVRIEKEAVDGTAQVTALTRTSGKSSTYYAVYGFEAGGQVVQGRATVGRSYWTRLRVGSSVPVRYLPSEPAQNWIRGYEPSWGPLWVAPLVAVVLALVSLVGWIPLRREWMLLMDGRGAEARVTGAKKFSSYHGQSTYRVNYEFHTLSGGVRTGNYASQQAPPAEGETIRIIYDPDNPARSEPYPLALVRPGY